MERKRTTLLHRIRNSFAAKVLALYLALSLLFDVVYPTASWALTGGPSQPEMGGFQPMATDNMVDMFTGDFKYNIPLINVDGYELNLAYNGGINADMEASWVGLGWSLNPGVINRSLRGIPDDFAGESIKKTYHVKPSRTFGINSGLTFEVFGVDPAAMFSGSVNFGLSVSYSNYEGIGIESNFGANFKGQLGPLTGGLGLTSSSNNGLTISPNVSIGLGLGEVKSDKSTTSLSAGLGVGSTFNTRAGTKQLSVNASLDAQLAKQVQVANPHNPSENITVTQKASGSAGVSGHFDLAMPTFSPQVHMSMHNISMAANFQLGPALIGTQTSAYVGGYYNGQKLISNIQSNPAYGYLHLEQGQNNQDAILDFGRENDGEFTTSTPTVALPHLDNDILTVTGQGVGGSYRPFRSEVGYVFDPSSYTTSEGFDLGLEFGVGDLLHGASEFSVNISQSNSGKWLQGNPAGYQMRFGKHGTNIDHEMYYYKEANEKSVESDPVYQNAFGGDQAVRVSLNTANDFDVQTENTFVKADGSTIPVPTANYRTKRDRRNQALEQLTVKEVKDGMGLENFPAGSYAQTAAPNHHIGQITTYNTNGMRYVYGIPAFNTAQKEVSFAAGGDMYNADPLVSDCTNGLVTYVPGSDNSTGNTHGKDNYYNAIETPAYAHSYLLTAVLSPDYIDADNIKGPSIGDMGYYTKFNYTRAYGNYQWRAPYEANTANYAEALKTDFSDDKGSYIHGTKEMWYLDKVETKNYVVIFELENRKDALGVVDENGGPDITQPTKLLRKISLYARKYYEEQIALSQIPVPLKEVHFEYDYSLCPGIPNYSSSVSGANPSENGGGKLTLKKVYFSYQNSSRSRLSPYSFQYNGSNPSYHGKSYDRWGNYKPNAGGCGTTDPLNNAEFPYVIQDQTSADDYSSSWNLTTIFLPSGGKMDVDYESDDYGYVQNKKAQRMLKIVGYSTDGTTGTVYSSPQVAPIGPGNDWLLFELEPGSTTDINKYFSGMDKIYFKALMQMQPNNFDYAPGYADISEYKIINVSGTPYGAVKLNPVNWNDSGAWGSTNPIVRTAVQFGRLQLQRFVYSNPAITDADNFGEQLINQLFASNMLADLISNTVEFVEGPNLFLYNNRNVATNMVYGKSWFRLNDPDGKKLGGGNRVKKIQMSDNWSTMTGIAGQTFDYGQEYFYDENGNGTGTTTGVASYEPQIGGEENPWKQPVAYSIEHCMAPDEKMYQEGPFGENFFPAPVVGYGKVTVRNLNRTNVTKHATGRVVHEFYTAKDFPTIVERTDRQLERDKTDPFSIASLLNISSRDYLTVSQGFKIELNDMHGKQKKQSVYQENQNTPITSVEYRYQQQPYGTNSFKLDNQVTTVHPNGTVDQNTVGVFTDVVNDFRESTSRSETYKLNVNGEAFILVVAIGVAPILIPKIIRDETQFHSAATTKVLQRFGIVKEVIATDLGSMVSTKNLAYDSETGDVLLTQTITDFNDETYTLAYPAHWYYDKGMGQVYKNIGISLPHTFTAGVANYANAAAYYVPGDELELIPATGPVTQAWVIDVNPNSFTAVNKAGTNISGTFTTKIIRSGRRNMAGTNIATVTTMTNPLDNFQANLFANVINASAIEFSDQWRTFCDCYGSPDIAASNNPYIMGTRGNWRPVKSLLHLSQRTQSHVNNNSNIRKDGVFVSYLPYYKLNSGHWMIDGKNWTYTSKVTEFSPFGEELENQDALGRYSAATFGYRQTFATAIAANARYRDIGTDNFEDYGFSPCADNHFKFTGFESNVTSGESHSGRNSIHVAGGNTVSLARVLDDGCMPGGCQLGLTNGPDVYTITNGTGPYSIQYEVLYGDPTITLLSNGFQVTNAFLSSFEVTITDAKGCTYTTTINH